MNKEFTMIFDQLNKWGASSSMLYVASIASVLLSMVLWLMGRGERGRARAGAERFAIFVGLWPPTLMIMGKILEDREQRQ